MRKVVVKTTPLIALSHVGQLSVLKELYGEIIIPEAVYRDSWCTDEGKTGRAYRSFKTCFIPNDRERYLYFRWLGRIMLKTSWRRLKVHRKWMQL